MTENTAVIDLKQLTTLKQVALFERFILAAKKYKIGHCAAILGSVVKCDKWTIDDLLAMDQEFLEDTYLLHYDCFTYVTMPDRPFLLPGEIRWLWHLKKEMRTKERLYARQELCHRAGIENYIPFKYWGSDRTNINGP